MGTPFFYFVKPLVPRRLQLFLRTILVRRARRRFSGEWPIHPSSGEAPRGWEGWPGDKKFALVLTHDVDTQKGHDAAISLMRVEKEAGFISSFNFVPERYKVSKDVLKDISGNGFEIGVHGLKHDGKLFTTRSGFLEQAAKINECIREWGAVGFRAPSMIRNLEWIKDLDIEYDASTFDTDPFEPQPEGMRTIFPFWFDGEPGRKGYVELPYTLCQVFSLFVLLREKGIGVWKEKLDWIAANGGMALINTHPDYMNFSNRPCGREEYPLGLYREFLSTVARRYADQYWLALPKDVARFWKHRTVRETVQVAADRESVEQKCEEG